MMKHTINVKELRATLPEIVKKIQRGDQYTVLYRSRPAFRIVGLNAEEKMMIPLSDDLLYKTAAVGASADGLNGDDHDLTLYGKQIAE
jgi:antitoxin (DNA-binding transcriptional repressor) of toxin-antitoxin stability system